jgi:hypothetical protein
MTPRRLVGNREDSPQEPRSIFTDYRIIYLIRFRIFGIIFHHYFHFASWQQHFARKIFVFIFLRTIS